MNISQVFTVVSIALLAIIALLLFLVRGKGKENQLTPLSGLAFGFVLAGILFGEEQWIGYGLFGIGIFLAVVDIIMKLRRR
jgi:amino acid transporter